jgi:hypothetical protein
MRHAGVLRVVWLGVGVGVGVQAYVLHRAFPPSSTLQRLAKTPLATSVKEGMRDALPWHVAAASNLICGRGGRA